MQQGFGVVLRLCGKCNENKMFSSVQWNLYGCFVVFINIMGIAVNLLKYSAGDDSLVSWSVLNAQAKTFPVVLFVLLSWNIFLVASSAVDGTLELRWIGDSRKNPGELCRLLLPCSLPSGQPLEAVGPGLGRRDRGAFADGQGSHKWNFLPCSVRGISHFLFSTLSSSVASLSLFSCWKEGFPVLFCSFTQYLWYWCVLLSFESERRHKKCRYCILFAELLHRPSATVTVLQVVHFSKEATELRQLWAVFLLLQGFE